MELNEAEARKPGMKSQFRAAGEGWLLQVRPAEADMKGGPA
jgi:hypothetical protein